MTDLDKLANDIRALCNGHPHAKIAWPHRELHALADRAQALARRDGVEEPVGDVIEGVRDAIKGLRAHVSAIQTDKRVGANAGSIYNCINDLPNIIRQLEAAEFEIEAEFERYEALSASPAPAGDLVERDIAVIRDMVSDYAGNEQWDAWSRIQNEMARLRAVIAAMQPGRRDKPHCQSCGVEIP